MKCLLIDDEPGIREGLAALLRRRGHEVRTAGDVQAALAQLASQPFELVITDWRLPDGVAESVVRASTVPVIAISGHPEEVTPLPQLREVLTKPVGPQQLIERVAAFAAEAAAAVALPTPSAETAPQLPVDLRHCIDAGLALLQAESCELVDDGVFVTVRCPLPSDDRLPALEALGGDLRVLTPGGHPTIEWRLYRDARPDSAMVTKPGASWPATGDVAVDFDGAVVTPADFDLLLRAVVEARAAGRAVHFLNVPPHLRFLAEVSGTGHDMPKRTAPGPRLAAVLADLWS